LPTGSKRFSEGGGVLFIWISSRDFHQRREKSPNIVLGCYRLSLPITIRRQGQPRTSIGASRGNFILEGEFLAVETKMTLDLD
jgi:hypothetical protein